MTTMTRELTRGAYYWVLVQSSKKAPEWQPARFTGIDGGNLLTWDFVGFNCDVGHHFVEVISVGDAIFHIGALESQWGAGSGMFAVSEALRTDDEAAP